MQSIEKKILTSVSKRGRGKIIFPQDFASYGTPNAVHKAFGRLVASDQLLRVAQGVYCYPKIDKVLGLGILYPTIEEIAAAIARRDKAKIIPSGAYALNKLGLSTQLPMNVVYLTDGSPRKVKLEGNRGIQFKHTAKKIWLFRMKSQCFSHLLCVKSEKPILTILNLPISAIWSSLYHLKQ